MSNQTSKVLAALPENPYAIDAQAKIKDALQARAGGLYFESLVRTVEALISAPDHPEALTALADLYEETGYLDKGEASLDRLLDLHPTRGDAAQKLARIMGRLGRPNEAAGLLETRRRAAPAAAAHALACGDMHRTSGNSAPAGTAYRDAAMASGAQEDECIEAAVHLIRMERAGDAVAATRHACQRFPKSTRLADLQATALLLDGRASQALQLATAQLSGGGTDRYHAYLSQGRALIDLGRPRQALGACRRAETQGAPERDVAGLRGLAYRLMGDAARAHRAYEKAVVGDNVARRVRYGRGVALAANGFPRQALTIFDALAADAPDDTEIHVERAALLDRLGETAAAGEAWAMVARLSPGCDGAALEVPGTLAFDLEPGLDLSGWAAIRDTGVLGAGERIGVDFALGHGLEAKGESRAAFAHWDAANRAIRSRFDFRMDSVETWLRRLPASLSDWSAPAPKAAESQPQPIFIVGMPGSGTTLVEACLSGHEAVAMGGEQTILPELLASGEFLARYPEDLPHLSETDLDALRDAYLTAAARLGHEVAFVTDKLCGNFAHLGLIHRLFPEAPIVHCMRDPRDITISGFGQWFGRGHHYAYDLNEMARMAMIERDVTADWQARLPAGRITEVCYEDLVATPERVLRRVLGACGLGPRAACFNPASQPRHIETASARRVMNPLNVNRRGRWRSYAAMMPMFDVE